MSISLIIQAIIIGFLIFMIGASFGSFLSVLFSRDKFLGKDGILFGRSKCPFCGKKLGMLNLFPIFSFVVQKGRCRNKECNVKIPGIYFKIEFAVGTLFLTWAVLAGALYFSSMLEPESLQNEIRLLTSLSLIQLIIILVVGFYSFKKIKKGRNY